MESCKVRRLVTPYRDGDRCRRGAVVGMAPWSGWRRGRNGAVVEMAPWSEWCRGRNGAVVGMAPWSEWRRGRNGDRTVGTPCPRGYILLLAPSTVNIRSRHVRRPQRS